MKTVSFKPFDNTDGRVVGYIHSPLTEMPTHRKTFPAVIVCPGGGYKFLSEREADPVAMRYFAAGYNVFILYYSIGENAKNFTPLSELAQTFAFIRINKDEFLTDPNCIAVCGFSAGGHLSASIGTLWNNETFLSKFSGDKALIKPNAMILSYPVITADEFAHQGSIESVSGLKFGESGCDFFSLDKRVTKDTCTAFIWHTVADTAVPIENSIKFITALQQNKIPYEAHFFPDGAHGMSVCTEETGSLNTYNARWMEMSIVWLNKIFNYTP